MAILLQDTFTDTNGTALASHTPDINNTGDTYHDPSSIYSIQSNEVVNTGGDVYTTYIALGVDTAVWTGKMYVNNASSFDASILFRSNGTTGRRIQVHSSGNIWLRDFGATTYDTQSWTPSVGYKDFTITLTATSVVVVFDGVTLNYNSSDLNTQTGIGIANWSGCSPKWDDFLVTTSNPLPVWESDYPFVDEITKNTATINAKIDVDGNAYFVCLPRGSATPMPAQVKAGTDADDVAVDSGLSGSAALTAYTEAEISATNLANMTAYDCYVVAENTDSDLQGDAELVEFLTLQSNCSYFKRSLLRVQTTVEFILNLGDTLDTAIDITRYVVDLSDITEKLTKSSQNVGGVILPTLKVKLDNSRGKFDKTGDFFKAGFVNNSIIKLTVAYIDANGNTLKDEYIYKGLIKYTSCDWDRVKHIFTATIIPASNMLSSEKIRPGTLDHESFEDLCYRILNRLPFTKYLTIDQSNFSLGWDITQIDSYADMTHKQVKTVLDHIMLLTGSIYYVDYDQNFIIEPIEPINPTSVCTLRGEDIFDVTHEQYDWKSQYTGITWDDEENTIQRVEMNFAERSLYQYDFTELKLTYKYVTDQTNRLTIMNNLLDLYKFLKREIKLTCKWNPDIIVNSFITLDVAAEVIIGDQYLVWNEDQWNNGKYWGLASPGISFSSSKLWRVTDIQRDSQGYKMRLTLVQLTSDDEV